MTESEPCGEALERKKQPCLLGRTDAGLLRRAAPRSAVQCRATQRVAALN
jgi:hypothetical protein